MMRSRPQHSFAPTPVVDGWRIKCDTMTVLAATVPHAVVPQLLRPMTASFLPQCDMWHCSSALRLVDRSRSLDPLAFFKKAVWVDELVLSGTPIDEAFLSCVVDIECDAARHAPRVPLQSLDIGFCPNVKAESLAAVSELRHLQHLRIHNCENLRTDALSFVGTMYSLRSLDLSWNAWVDAQALSHIRALPLLESLSLEMCKNVDNRALWQLLLIPFRSAPCSLTALSLRRCDGVTDTGLSYVASMTSLTSLDVSHCGSISSAGLSHVIASLQALTYLTSGCDVLHVRGHAVDN